MGIQVPGAGDQFASDRALLEQIYRFDTSKIAPSDVTEIAALSEGGRVSVDELRPLFNDAILARLAEVALVQAGRTGGRR